MTALWTSSAEAQAILAELAVNPPAKRMFRISDLTTRHEERYVGAAVMRLRRIKRKAEADTLDVDQAAFEANCRLTVDMAIDDARIHAKIAESRAADQRSLEALESRSVAA